ncbi:response regulator transcription factor [Aliihoeflea sp. 40Bstr573]|uniref:response regulator n=1 Tax=Aliihoeflea sp. 40Bstr573 TaxID=2696467 RepID=UPI0020941D46|nr:response regulator transcription factor [Aliihoeflea sp. 40Bstr573]MCO6386673.1 response regulator [Aliihoeflea sp. 40Bstr573]
MRILLVEDDKRTSDYISSGLASSGHVTDVLADGRDALAVGLRESYDVVIVDRMIPGLDGVSLVKSLRAAGGKLPIILLTALGGVEDRVEGLEAGADDYLTKPFAFSELLARLHALGRRPPMAQEKTVLRVADLELDLVRRIARRAGQIVELLPREFSLLEFLMRNEGRVLTKTMLLERIWNFNFDPQSTVVETHVSRLRAKIDRPFEVQLIHTVRSTGYSLHAPR